MPVFDAILFDFDGVIMDSEPVHFACWREVLLPLGVRLEWDYYLTHGIGIDDKLMLQQLVGDSRDWRELWSQYPAKKELFRSRMLASPPFPENLGALLADLHAAYRLAIVSSSSSSEIEPLVERAGLRRYFSTIVGGDHVTRHKPAPEPYLLAAERLAVRSPLVIEDSEAGAAAGRAAGFPVLQIRHPSELEPALRARLSDVRTHTAES
ncbi:MAG TPA: HAD family phosphatase [Bryobacteraceae bacterium]|nr:HAD family phosphatase [Bryobacteraceae bacterium]